MELCLCRRLVVLIATNLAATTKAFGVSATTLKSTTSGRWTAYQAPRIFARLCKSSPRFASLTPMPHPSTAKCTATSNLPRTYNTITRRAPTRLPLCSRPVSSPVPSSLKRRGHGGRLCNTRPALNKLPPCSWLC